MHSGADFDGLDKTELRENLLKEQGYICAYCMKRIRDEKDTKIEHYRARNMDNELEYTNLLAVCYGNQITTASVTKTGKKRFTCDTMKGNQVLNINPQNQEAKELLVKYKRKVLSLSYGEEYPEYIGVLNWYVAKQMRKHGMS